MPVIDLFAGPGGLGEGFASLRQRDGTKRFSICLSIEKDPFAHRTLELRALYRHLHAAGTLHNYYSYLRGQIDRDTLFARHPTEADASRAEAWNVELCDANRGKISSRIESVLKEHKDAPWLLLGGPPCQAYSVAGRSRMRRVMKEKFERDHRHTLYREYLAIIADHRPDMFIMENVKGLLSSETHSGLMFEMILDDLRTAASDSPYVLYSFVHRPSKDLFNDTLSCVPSDFIIESELYGVPQARHRVILLGIRSDRLPSTDYIPPLLRRHKGSIPVSKVIRGLPKLRSGLSDREDTPSAWCDVIQSYPPSAFIRNGEASRDLRKKLKAAMASVSPPPRGRGGSFVSGDMSIKYRPKWFLDSGIGGVCNHETRDHMGTDLHRYLFCAVFAALHKRTPKLRDFPPYLLPDHSNVQKALDEHGNFNDRFRVQVWNSPATTITSHIAKDGHYYIHPDFSQCRSLTVREVARLQTFPDNYFFEGPRTHQYRQVGNAVPPLLAAQLARTVSRVLDNLA